VVNSGSPETTYYVYDASGQRVRKVTERQAAEGEAPTRKDERLYLGGFEIYREYAGDGTTVTLERETLHVMDGKQRVAMVETRTHGDDGAPAQLLRFQLGNHLGSASLELDEQGRIISYEEYYPYGSTSYQAVDKSIKAAAKRYRYTGMERDEETGLAYHGARYYAGWLGRWTACDPAGMVDGVNGMSYARNNPITLSDRQGFRSEEGVDIDQDDDEPSDVLTGIKVVPNRDALDREEMLNIFVEASSQSSDGLDPGIQPFVFEFVSSFEARLDGNITIYGSATFQQKVIRDFETLIQYDVGRLIVEDLMKSDVQITLMEAKSFYPNELTHFDWWLSGGPILSAEHRAILNSETRQNGAKSFTIWYSQYDDVILDRVISPPFVILAHELFHVRQLLRPTDERDSLFRANPVSGVNNIETEAVEFENRLRKAAELPLRRYYGLQSLQGGPSIWPWESYTPDKNQPEDTESPFIYDPHKTLPLP
jgi:RHS repeat-associated protein